MNHILEEYLIHCVHKLYESENVYEKKVFLSQLLCFSEEKINIMHDFIEYDKDMNTKHTKKPQWFHSSLGVYFVSNNINKFDNPQIKYIIKYGLKEKLDKICIDIISLDAAGKYQIEIMNNRDNFTIIDQKHDTVINYDKSQNTNANIDISVKDSKIETVIHKLNNL